MENRMMGYFEERTELVRARLEAVQARFEAEGTVWAEGLRRALEAVLEKGAALQEAGRKGAGAYVCISFLRTSLLNGKFELRIDLYDEGMYMDESECEAYWEAEALAAYFAEDGAYFADCARRGVVRLLEAEVVDFLQEYGDAYFELLGAFCAEAVAGIEDWEAWKRLRWAALVRVTYGEYMDKGLLLRSIGEEEEDGAK